MTQSRLSELECSIGRTVAIVGQRWTPVILRAIFEGRRRFDAIQEELGIARNILSDRLRTLEAAAALAAAARLFTDVQAMTRLALSGRFDRETAPEGVRRALCRAAQAVDFADLQARLGDAQARVRRGFDDIVASAAGATSGTVRKDSTR